MKFTLNESLNCEKEVFSINCYQQGNRLANKRLKGKDKFVPSAFSIILMTQEGKFIAGSHSGEYAFVATLLLKEGVVVKVITF